MLPKFKPDLENALINGKHYFKIVILVLSFDLKT